MKYINILLFILLISCKNDIEDNKVLKGRYLVENKHAKVLLKIDSSLKNKSDGLNGNCEDLLKKFVKSSNLKSPFLNVIEVKIESVETSRLRIQLFIKTPAGENSETTIGWLILDAENKKLFDITNDIDSPEILSFNTNLWNQIVKCFLDNKNQYLMNNEKETNENKFDWKCADKGGDMNNGYITNCLTKSILKISYSQLKQVYFEDGKLLLNILPKRDTIYIKENVKINYEILSVKNVKINLLYGGGVTKFNLIEINGRTNIIKTMFPD